MREPALTLLFLFVLCLTGCGCRDMGIWDERGEEEREPNVMETGELKAQRVRSVLMPSYDHSYGHLQITFMEKEGIQVRKGHVVARIETEKVKKILEQKESELAMAMSDFKKMQVDHRSSMRKLESQLVSAEAALNQALIDTARVRYESGNRREISLLEFEKRKISLGKARKKIEATIKIQAEEIKIQESKLARTRAEIDKALRTIESLSLEAPGEGLVVHEWNRHQRRKVQVGDDLWRGRPIILLPDLSRMKVVTSVNEIDISRVYMGQRVRVRLDAFPKIAFEGEVILISVVCRKKNRDSNIKVFDVEILLDENHRILKPGMTAGCEFLTGQ